MLNKRKTLRSFFVRIGLLVLAFVLVSTVAMAAETLEDRVKVLEDKSDNVGFDKRPYIQSDDGRFRIEFGARFQVRYTAQIKDSRGGSGSATTTDDESFAELERARLSFRGNFFSKDLKYKIEADGHGDSGGGSLALTDAYVQYHCPDTGVVLSGGQWKPFFGRQEQTSSGSQLLVDRSLANEFFNIDRNVGFWLSGREKCADGCVVGGYSWQLAISNGIDSVNKGFAAGETDQIPAIIAHFDVDVLGNLGKDALSSGDLKRREEPGLTMGVSFVSDQNNNSGANAFQEFKVYQMAYDAVFKCHGFNFNAEYFQRWLDLDDVVAGSAPTDSQFTHGGYVESGYMVTDAFQVVGRASSIWDRDATGKSAFEGGAGVNYFFYKHNLKLSADLLYLDIPANMSIMTEKLPGHGVVGSGATPVSFASSSANLAEFQGVMIRAQAQVSF